ncbi:MAG: 2-isopropylmalate synthase [Lentisphaerae bacterium GWF2_45_14]|nr:MAG: 2-isopropylmalate synthase [Lentisphaerae bacterium GWF2_45_14]
MKSSYPKYKYPAPLKMKNRQWPDKILKKAPVWCSVDLRDGNQALPVPMNPEKKLDFFKMLVKIGFKEIEVGFPSASKDDFDFVRYLIEEDIAPKDVKISVLTQARPHLIKQTVESLEGVNKGIIHCYVATSDLHGRFVFGNDRKKVLKMAVDGTKMIVDGLEKAGLRKKVGYEFSPEEFTDSDIGFVIELCKAVKETWGKSRKGDFILNLPATVERRPPYQYADMIEYFCEHYPYLDETSISIHAHNDQGCAVAASEMALMAGGNRIEGTIFGHGERTGNLDISTLALNLYSRGVDPKLDFSDMPGLVRLVEEVSNIPVHPRHPYAGQLAFTAFSGSHQDAIRKGMDSLGKAADYFRQGWKVPYLHIDPADIGRNYEKLIRINSQSGKGGVTYVLENDFGIYPPKAMQPQIGTAVQLFADSKGGEINSQELLDIFRKSFIDVEGPYKLIEFVRSQQDSSSIDSIWVILKVESCGEVLELEGFGNGPISATVHALKQSGKFINFRLEDFTEQSLGHDCDATAMAYVGIRTGSEDKIVYGAGEHSNIDMAALKAIFAALNKAYNEK